jgi:streptogramin lyase
MRRFDALVFSLLLAGCSSHNAIASPETFNEAAPQVVQGYGGGRAWTTVHLLAKGTGNVIGVVHWHGASMTALQRTPFTNSVLMISEGGVVTSMALPEAEVEGDAVGPDGNLWITVGRASSQIESITPTGSVSVYPLRSGVLPIAICAGPDGAMWFGEDAGNSPMLGRITTSGTITEYPYPSGVANLPHIVSGSDGNLWATADSGGSVYRITAAGVFTAFPISGGSGTVGLVADAGDVWTISASGGMSTLTSVDPSGVINQYPDAADAGWGEDLGVGTDGNLWAMDGSKGISSFNVTTHEFSTPSNPPPPGLFLNGQFVVGPDGNMWTDLAASRNVAVYLWHSMTVTPSPLTISTPGLQANLSVTETNYSGNWSGSSSNKAVATVARGTKGTLVVTAVGVGSCVLTINDSDHNTVKVKVTVQ